MKSKSTTPASDTWRISKVFALTPEWKEKTKRFTIERATSYENPACISRTEIYVVRSTNNCHQVWWKYQHSRTEYKDRCGWKALGDLDNSEAFVLTPNWNEKRKVPIWKNAWINVWYCRRILHDSETTRLWALNILWRRFMVYKSIDHRLATFKD